jgi:hypothetical protein
VGKNNYPTEDFIGKERLLNVMSLAVFRKQRNTAAFLYSS